MQVHPETLQYAFFDVDGTVIARDSFRILMREMILKGNPIRIAIAFVLCVILSVGKFMGIVGKTQFKSALLWSATVGMTPRQSLTKIRSVVNEFVKPLWFVEMGGELERLRNNGMKVCYVSASGEYWLRVLLKDMDPGAKLIVGSRLMIFFGGVTLRGPNCLGDEKIRRLRALLPADTIWSCAYSDHRADLPLLLASRNRVVVNPTPRNLRAFQNALGSDGFTVAHWTPTQEKRSQQLKNSQ
ncbi:MAG: HAD-IB family phosphatase [Silvanigrellaceae bacterium]